MRVLTMLVIALAARTAAADPSSTCYGGTATSDGKARPYVEMREYDPAKHEVRLHTWREAEPRHESVWIWHIADDGKSYSIEAGSVHGKGTLDGTPWKWTGYHTVLDLRGNPAHEDGKIEPGGITASAHIEVDGKSIMKTDYLQKAFDCKDLAKRRAALDDTAPDARHVCFGGEETAASGRKRPVVIEQIFEPNRVKLILTNPLDEMRFVLAVDGNAIKVTNGERSWEGTGTIEGKAGAWTRFAFTAKVNGDMSLAVDSTLGGKHITQHGMGTTGAHVAKTTTEADAFDCKDLPVRIEALH